jgi:hypothetical protein
MAPMDKLETLDRGIRELRGFISQGWRDIAAGNLTSYERCEIRERMTRAETDLRRCLQAHEDESRRLRELSQNAGGGGRSVALRFLNTDYGVTVAPVSTSPPSRVGAEAADAE